jgi:hypothetical protein
VQGHAACRYPLRTAARMIMSPCVASLAPNSETNVGSYMFLSCVQRSGAQPGVQVQRVCVDETIIAMRWCTVFRFMVHASCLSGIGRIDMHVAILRYQYLYLYCVLHCCTPIHSYTPPPCSGVVRYKYLPVVPGYCSTTSMN